MTIKKQGYDAAGGPFEIPFTDHKQSGSTHTIQITMRDSNGAIATPTAGTLTIKVRAPGGAAFEDVGSNAIDVTSRANWMQTIVGQHIEALELTPASVDAGFTFDVAISSSFGGA